MTSVSMWEFLLGKFVFLNPKKNELRNPETQRKYAITPVRIKLNN